jgi:hypothetical protein
MNSETPALVFDVLIILSRRPALLVTRGRSPNGSANYLDAISDRKMQQGI